MSFLVGEEDDPVVVEEALAFIESFSTGSTDSRATVAAAAQPPPNPPPAKPNAKKRRVRTFASSSTRQLQRKKAEMASLRAQALALQSQLQALQLQRAKCKALPAPAKDAKKATAEWHSRATAEFVHRQQSESTNKQLRCILANQRQVDEALRGVLQRRGALHGMDFVFGGAPPIYRSPREVDNSAGLMKMLETRVEQLYIDSNARVGWDQPCLVSSTMNVKNNTQYGQVVEIETVTPVDCSIREAAAILWKDLKTVHEIPDKRYRYLRGNKPNSLEKNFIMKLRGEQSDMVINGAHFSRKFEDNHRIVLAKADAIILPTQGLEFRSPSWTIITPSESNPRRASEVRTYVRIYAEVQPHLGARVEDVEHARDFVLNALSKMMFGCALKTQGELIQQSLLA